MFTILFTLTQILYWDYVEIYQDMSYNENKRSVGVILIMMEFTAVPKPSASKQKETRPKRDEFELEELAEKLDYAKEERKQLILSVWKKDDPISGVIEKLDSRTKLVHVKERYGSLIKIPFIDILRAADPESL